MSSREYAEWQEYFRLEPFGPSLALLDSHLSRLQMMYAEAHRDPKKRSGHFRIDEFSLLDIDRPDNSGQTWDQIKGVLKLFSASLAQPKKGKRK